MADTSSLNEIFEELFSGVGSTGAIASDPEKSRRAIQQIGNADRLLEERRLRGDIPGNSLTEDIIFGQGTQSRNVLQQAASGVRDLVTGVGISTGLIKDDPSKLTGSRAKSLRDELIAIEWVEAYDSLRGAAAITEYEGKVAANARSSLEANLTDAELAAELQRVSYPARMAQGRQRLGIETVNENGNNREYLINKDGVREQVITYMQDGQIRYQPTGGEDIIVIPQEILVGGALEAAIKALPEGQKYVRTDRAGEIFTRGTGDTE